MGDEKLIVQCPLIEIISRRALMLRIRQPFSSPPVSVSLDLLIAHYISIFISDLPHNLDGLFFQEIELHMIPLSQGVPSPQGVVHTIKAYHSYRVSAYAEFFVRSGYIKSMIY